MRIVIDMQGAQTESRFRGIGRYTMSLAQAIVRNKGEHEVILALSGLFPNTIEPIRAAFDGLLPQENIRVWYAPSPVKECEPGNDWRREVAELIREAFLASLQPDVIHISSLFEGYIDDAVTSIGRFDTTTQVSVSLYDLIPMLNPDQYLKPNPRYAQHYRCKIEHLKQAAICLAISDFTRQEGLAHLRVPASCVVNVSTAIESHFQPLQLDENIAAQLRLKFNLSYPFVFCAGGADERKNLPRLIQAFAALPAPLRASHQLLLSGQIHNAPYLKKIAKSARLKPDELCFTGYVTDEDLVQLYNLCKLFVFPSWHEGFGLPVLEAMACGTPVICSNTSSLPEVVGLDDAMFDPLDVGDIASKMERVLQDDQYRTSLKEHGLEQAKNFSWDSTAIRAINAFEKITKVCKCPAVEADKSDPLSDLVYAVARKAKLNCTDADLLGISDAIGRIPVEMDKRQLFVDISELAQRDAMTGVQRVTRSILRELVENPPEGFLVKPVFANIDRTGYFHANTFMARFMGRSIATTDDLIEYYAGDVFLGLDLQHHTTRVQAGYLSRMRSDGVKIFFVVYDLLPVLLPNCWPPEHSVHQVHHEWLSVVSQFDGAVCISKSVAEELKEWQDVNIPKRKRAFQIKWFHLGADLENSVPTMGLPDNSNDLIQKLISKPTFVIVGTVEPRKGQAQTLAAFEQLWQHGHNVNLVIVGKEGWMVENLVEKLRNHPELNNRLFWLEGISDEYLEKVYAASTCLIAASFGEGFGLPLIEAAQHKLPIIARDIPVSREVAGKYAFYFQGMKPVNLADALKDWLNLHAADQHPKSDAMPWLTWKQSAQQLINAILFDNRYLQHPVN